LLSCVHASKAEHGCGTTKFCRQCGAVNTILKTQTQKSAFRGECVITTTTGDALEFAVSTSIYNVDSIDHTVFSIEDISDHNRRLALERTFFHDVTNTLNTMLGYSSLLVDESLPAELSNEIEIVRLASRELVQQVASHRSLLNAENGELATNITKVQSAELVNEVAQFYVGKRGFSDRTTVVNEDSEDVEIATDRVLLLRVLGNMVKNALEAATAGQTVSVGCIRHDTSVVFSVFNPNLMSESVQLQVFKRSFSTKGPGRGLGTYSMKLYGERYLQGKVWFTTSEEGTTFYISVPMAWVNASD